MVQRNIVEARGNPLEKLIPSRYIFAVLGCIGVGIIYGLKVNLSVGIVSMVNNTALIAKTTNQQFDEKNTNQTFNVKTDKDECFVDEKNILNSSKTYDTEDGPFLWSKTELGTIMSAYFCGYILTQLPGGRVAELFSAKWVLICSVAINVICTLLTPVLTEIHYSGLLVLRFLEGLAAGVSFPSMHVMLARWAPTSERAVMSTIVYSGASLGTVIFTFVTGMIAKSFGWQAIFYIEGSVSAVWLILWYILVTDSPNDQWFISQKERDFINESLNVRKSDKIEKRKFKVPWKKVFTSRPFWALLVAHCCGNWGWYVILMELPLYMKDVLKFKISENAALSALPYLTLWIASLVLSKILDTLKAKGVISTTTARKIATVSSSIIPAICFVILCYIGCSRFWATFLMTLGITGMAGASSGFLMNHIDIAPNFAGTLMATTNTFGTLPGIIVPIFVNKLTEKDPTIRSWRIIFASSIFLFIVEAIIYVLFGSGEIQEWNEIDNNDENMEKEQQPLKTFNEHS